MYQGLVGVSGVIRTAVLNDDWFSRLKTFEIKGVGGNMYRCSHLSQGTASAFTSTDSVSGQGDTNTGSWLL